MNGTRETIAGKLLPGLRVKPIQRLYRRVLLDRLRQIRTGEIRLREGSEHLTLGRVDAAGLSCDLTVRDGRFFADVVRGGSIGAADSYVRGRWQTDDLTNLIRILARDRRSNQQIDNGAARVRLFVDRIRHALRRNTRSGSRKNIAGHYDLGNDFFATFLDPTLTYSCGVFADDGESMEQASTRKYDLICRKLELKPGDEVFEIGTGWGGFAIHAARSYRCRIVSTTISREQYELASQRVRDAGVGDRVALLLEDYRSLPLRFNERFDHLVSIEMIEAVGHRYLDEYFRACASVLKPGGTMLLQGIVIADQNYESYRRSVDFIQRYIFPGGLLPSVTSICDSMTRSSDLRIANLQDITSHYPRTLRRWKNSFEQSATDLEALGFDERFRRLWEFYFSYCEAGFLERTIGTVQMLLARSAARVPELIPQS